MLIESYLQQSPIFQVNRIARRMDASLNELLTNEGLTGFEALILAAIFLEKGGAVQPSTLAETFQTTRGNVSHCISSLEAKGLVQRRIDAEDARALKLVLKPLGKRSAARVVGILDGGQRRIEDAIGIDSLQAMLQRMKAVEEVCERVAKAVR